MNIYEELTRRGLLAQKSHEKEIEALFGSGKPVKFYIGFDATADSLHIGSLVQLIVMKHLQNAGHIPICLLGTGTTVVGDPSDKTGMRKMLDSEEIEKNAAAFRIQMSKILDFDESRANHAEIKKNGDWLLPLNYLEFIREIGVHFSVNRMLAAECYKQRLERGLSFFELNYMLLQSYDFLRLYRTEQVTLQLGGDDQWSNILAGADLIRRADQGEAYAMTVRLLLTTDGKKMGKTEKGAVWLSEAKTSPYEMFQYLRNIDDKDVLNTLKMLTFVPIETLEQMPLQTGAELNAAKELLAYEVVKTVHGEAEAETARAAARGAFSGEDTSNLPSVSVGVRDIGILDLLIATGQVASKREARQSVEQGGVFVDNVKITDVTASVSIGENGVVVKKGKKSFIKAMI